MAGKPDHDGLFVVVNAGNKDEDLAFWQANLSGDAKLTVLDDRALIAIQGPEAAEVMVAHEPVLAEFGFMDTARLMLFGVDCYISRSGYTGEDGYEISVPAAHAERVWNLLLEDARVKPIGLGARDSLRLEAGLPLYGHDMSPETSPIEAGLVFGINKRRRAEGGFPGADRIIREIAEGTARRWVGLKIEGRLPAREGAEVFSGSEHIGTVTSGGFSPTLGAPIAMAYVASEHTAIGTQIEVEVRGKRLAATVAATPFVPHRYYRGS
jgi:aminomethyltransferase